MNKKLTFVEINYHCHHELTDPHQVIEKHRPSNLFAEEFLKYADVALVKHANYEGEVSIGRIHYRFFKRPNRVFQIPSKTHGFIKSLNPDLVLIQGFIFPVQVIMLRKKLGNKPVFLLQHQGDLPVGKKRLLQRRADKSVSGYLFNATGNALKWIDETVIADRNKCFEIPSASNQFSRLDKQKSKELTGMDGHTNFLWVGRLNANKDPITVLKAFEIYFAEHTGTLWMLYGEKDMLKEVETIVSNSTTLHSRVKLVGTVPYSSMQYWYSAADYYVSASWNEGGSYALIEALACGCVPIVTNIPPAMKAIDNGNCGFYFRPGDVEGLVKQLNALKEENRESMALTSMEYFKQQMSPAAIADQLHNIYLQLKTE